MKIKKIPLSDFMIYAILIFFIALLMLLIFAAIVSSGGWLVALTFFGLVGSAFGYGLFNFVEFGE